MANICEFNYRITGNKYNCYAFFGGQANYDDWIVEESGTENNYSMLISGSCKWDVDYYCTDKAPEGILVPQDTEAAIEYGSNNFWTVPLIEKAIALNINLKACWADIDEAEFISYIEITSDGNILEDICCPFEDDEVSKIPNELFIELSNWSDD